MNNYESDIVFNATNKFWSRLGWITAKAMLQAKDLSDDAKQIMECQLQDACSIYGTDFREKLKFLEHQKKLHK